MLILKTILAIVALPFAVSILVPAYVLQSAGDDRIGWGWPFPWATLPASIGLLFIGIGLYFLIATIRLFATVGRGTLAPWHPPQKLVVQGPYRYVRNPMITGVLSILIGESIFFGSLSVLYWFIFAAALNGIYIPLVEEPDLVRRFGKDYLRYKKNVPRWIPRKRPWNGEENPTA
jgi:protein-S-isoprenylcysteine O-methyltransferase Ste14